MNPLVTGREKQPHAGSDLNFEHHLREEEEDFIQPLSDLYQPSTPGKKSVLGFVQRETCQSVCDQLNKDSDRLREKAAKGCSNSGRSNRLQRQKKDTTELNFEPQDVDEKIKNLRCRAEIGCSRGVAVEAEAGNQKRSVHILDLPSEILVKIFALLPTYQNIHCIPHVCQRFRRTAAPFTWDRFKGWVAAEDRSLRPLDFELEILELLKAGQHDRHKNVKANRKWRPGNKSKAAAEQERLTEESAAAARATPVISSARAPRARTPSTNFLMKKEKLCLGSNNNENAYLAIKKRGTSSLPRHTKQ